MKDQEDHRIYRKGVARQGRASKLSRPKPVRPTEIVYNPEVDAIEFEDRHGTVGRLLISGETVLYEGVELILKAPRPKRGTPPIRRS